MKSPLFHVVKREQASPAQQLMAYVAAVILALAGAWAATALDVELLRKPFGVYLLLSGVSLIWPGKKKGENPS